MKIIGADARLAEKRGAKILIVGPAGVGKTSLLRTLDLDYTVCRRRGRRSRRAGSCRSPLFASMTGRPRATSRAASVVRIRRSRRPRATRQAHFESVGGALENLDRYKTIFVDSITAISRLSFRHAEQQPEAFSCARRERHPWRVRICTRAKC